MGIRLNSLKGVAIATAAVCGFANSAIADPDPSSIVDLQNSRLLRIDQQFERTFFDNDKEFYINRSLERQLDFLFGFRNSFTDNEINRDSRRIHELYVEVLEQQNTSDPIIRTPDLPNPFNRSLLQIPPTNFNRPGAGREFINEEQPPL